MNKTYFVSVEVDAAVAPGVQHLHIHINLNFSKDNRQKARYRTVKENRFQRNEGGLDRG